MKMIAVADQTGGIGCDGSLLVDLPTDMRYFREKTSGSVVIMGRKTLESFPGGKPLPNRRNIVLSRTLQSDEVSGFELCRSAEQAVKLVEDEDQEHVFVVGGGEIYKIMLPYVDEALITELETTIDSADTFIPVFAQEPGWELVSRSDPVCENGVTYTFAVYRRKDK